MPLQLQHVGAAGAALALLLAATAASAAGPRVGPPGVGAGDLFTAPGDANGSAPDQSAAAYTASGART
jgi:hypothetical protein